MMELPKNFLNSGALLSLRPGVVLVAWGAWRWAASPAKTGPSFFAPDFFLTRPHPWGIPAEFAEVSIEELKSTLAAWEREVPALTWQEPGFESFRKTFMELQGRFDSGQLQKAVPVVFARGEAALGEKERAQILLSLLERGSGRHYGIWNSESGMLGSTPEDLFTLDLKASRIRTMALAGTKSREEGAAAILADPKERREHQLVIDDLRSSLSRFGRVSVQETGVLELPTLLHLKTVIEVDSVSTPGFDELVRAAHPTAALGAFPRQAGWEWLLEQNRREERGRFGAPFGVFWPGSEAVCAVAIRGLQWNGSELLLGSGCGIIRESVLEREWAELALKRESVKKVLGL